jgi:hypothetical protein
MDYTRDIMVFPRSIILKRIAIGAIAALTTLSMASAQAPAPEQGQGQGRAGGGGRGRGRGRGGPTYTPAAGAKDLKSVLFNWGWYMGMLRSDQERDLMMSLEYQGKGTMQVNGQPCNLTKYRTSISYRESGERIQYTGTRPNGQACSNVEVLSGAYAWNEDIPGAELDPGKGKATPMPATVEERMIRLWAGPQGAFKAAIAGTEVTNPPEMAAKPQMVPADVPKAGKTSVVWENNKPVVTFPIPGVPNAIATATLDARFMPEHIVVKQGAKTYDFTYSNYKDWNNPLNPAEAFYAGKMTEKQNGTVVRDITTTVTETGQMYVVVPVPASIKAAEHPTDRPLDWTVNSGAPPRQEVSAAVTPRLADGHPDMTGNWAGAPLAITGSGTRRCDPTQKPGGGINPEVGCRTGQDNFWLDYEWISPSRFGLVGNAGVSKPSHPTYKPEFWDKVQELDQWTNKYDPIMTCQPMGMPREGTPSRIMQSATDLFLIYTTSDYGGGSTEFRDIPTDGRARPKTVEGYYNGLSIGKWEGDTLVIDSTNFVDTTWFGRGGFFHSADMTMVEKLTRKGDEILYQATITDPDSLVEPWVLPDRILRLRQGAPQIIHERPSCEVYETKDITGQERH